MDHIDDELHRRITENKADRSRREAEQRLHTSTLAELEKAKWAEIDDLCRAGVRQLEAAEVPLVEVGEIRSEKLLFGLFLDSGPMYRSTGFAWVLPYAGFIITPDAKLLGYQRGDQFQSFDKKSPKEKYLVQPLSEFEMVHPKFHKPTGFLLEEWELGRVDPSGEGVPYLLKETLMRGLVYTLDRR